MSPARLAQHRVLAAEVWRLAWPAISHMALVTLVLMVDRILLGRFSSDALASMQISGTLVWTVYSVFTASAAGTVAVVARRYGAGDLAGAAAGARASLKLALGIGAVFILPMWLAIGPILRTLFPSTDPLVMADAVSYMRIVLPVMPLAFLESAAAASLHAIGDTRTPLKVAIAGGLLNLVLSSLLVFGYLGAPRLGIVGAAIGTAMALALEGAVLVLFLYAKRSPLPMRSPGVPSALPAVLRISVPAFIERFAYQVGYLGFTAIITTLGAVAMAANQALISLESICFLSAEGFGMAAAAIVGQKLGQQRPEESTRAGLMAAAMSVAMLSSFGLLFAVAPRALIAVFSSDPEILAMGARAIYVTAVAQPFMATAIVLGMALRGAGDTRSVLYATLASALVVRVGGTYLFAITLGYGLVGVWMGSTLDWVVRTVWLGAVYARGRWRSLPIQG